MSARLLSWPARRSVGFKGIDILENRRLMSITLGTNAIVDPGAESTTGSATGNDIIVPSGWTSNGNATIVQYGAPEFPTATGPGPTSRGKNFFAGGPSNSESDFFQKLDASNLATSIDAKQIKFTLDGFLGGFSNQTDNASVFLNFQNNSNGLVSQVSIGPVTNTNRNNMTGLIEKSLNGTIPATTRFIQVQIHFEGGAGSYNDGYADNLSLVLTSSAPVNGSIAGTVFNDINGNMLKDSGENGLAGSKVYVDLNNNGKLDSGEPNFTTTSTGAYKFSNLPAKTYVVRDIAPSTYRVSTTNPLSVVVGNGQNVTGKNFGDSQTVLITGTVFGDTNGNGKLDSGEKGLYNVIVYLDFNNNQQPDSFELKTATNASGVYQFVLPFGTYIIRQVVPSGKKQTTPGTTAGIHLTLAEGATSTGNLFGDETVPT
jgi:SdrD B-like domain